jgi:hypothetical protein
MNSDVDEFRLGQAFAVDANLLALAIDAGSLFGDDFTIDFDAAFSDEFFALPSAGNSGRGEYLLESVACSIGCYCGI